MAEKTFEFFFARISIFPLFLSITHDHWFFNIYIHDQKSWISLSFYLSCKIIDFSLFLSIIRNHWFFTISIHHPKSLIFHFFYSLSQNIDFPLFLSIILFIDVSPFFLIIWIMHLNWKATLLQGQLNILPNWYQLCLFSERPLGSSAINSFRVHFSATCWKWSGGKPWADADIDREKLI